MPNENSPTKTEMTDTTLLTILKSIHESKDELRNCILAVEGKFDYAMTIIHKLEATCAGLDQRMTAMEEDNAQMRGRISAIGENQEATHFQGDDLQKGVISITKNITSEISEQMNRYQRRMNIVIMGVPENPNAADTMVQLFEIIWPGNLISNWTRIGDVNKTGSTARPIRVSLPNTAAKREIFANCKKLKDLDQFRGISVRRDLTKQQLEESKHNYGLRSRNRGGNKRKAPTDEAAGPSSKKNIIQQEDME